MIVTVLDRAAMDATWGSGPTQVITRRVEIADTCPQCGGPRGAPNGYNGHEDGVSYWVNVWLNSCGHTDYYVAVLAEARRIAEAEKQCGALREDGAYCVAEPGQEALLVAHHWVGGRDDLEIAKPETIGGMSR
jgi:hypothetical protein